MVGKDQFEREALPQLGALSHFAYQLCRDSQFSRDLVQETLLKACRSFHTYQTGTNCRAWLFQICKNSYLNDYRRRQILPVPVSLREDSVEKARDTDEMRTLRVSIPDEREGWRHRACLSDEVLEALDALPDVCQTAVILRDIEGHSYEEVAAFMRAPVGTIRSRIHRGRKMLAARLEDYARDSGWIRMAKTA
jgi:RNA polymerase sigma-70 factor, ECF subfamily